MPENLLRKKVVPAYKKPKFLLDENVSNNLKKFLISSGYDVVSVQDLNKRGAKNSELMELARVNERILITYDKDFIHFKHKKDDLLIIIDIHPLIDENVLPVFKNNIHSLKLEDLAAYYIILENRGFKLEKK